MEPKKTTLLHQFACRFKTWSFLNIFFVTITTLYILSSYAFFKFCHNILNFSFLKSLGIVSFLGCHITVPKQDPIFVDCYCSLDAIHKAIQNNLAVSHKYSKSLHPPLSLNEYFQSFQYKLSMRRLSSVFSWEYK